MSKEKLTEYKPQRSILQHFEEEECRIRKETEAMDKDMFAKLKVRTVELEAARKARSAAQAELDRMKGTYAEVEELTIAEELNALNSTGKTKADVLAGRISAAEYLKDGLTPEETAKRATVRARERLTGLLTEIRKKAFEVLELEITERTIEVSVFFLSTYPGQNELARLKSLTQALETRVIGHMQGWPEARGRLDRLQYIKNGFDQGNQWFDLPETEVKDLRFSPEFPEKYIGELEEIIAKIAGTGRKYRIKWGRDGASYFEE